VFSRIEDDSEVCLVGLRMIARCVHHHWYASSTVELVLAHKLLASTTRHTVC
jgi:hypothetical protein